MKKVPVMVDNGFTLTERYAHRLVGRQVTVVRRTALVNGPSVLILDTSRSSLTYFKP